MLPVYRMVIVNVVLSSFVLLGFFLYRFVYPKKRFNLFVLLLLISLLPLVSLLRDGVYESGDFNLHIYRTMAFFSNLQIGQFYPSWAGELNASFGYPLFIFINPLPYYLISFFHFLGFSFIWSMKLFLGFSFIFSGLGMYLWIYEQFKNKLAAFTAGIFYLFAPYHLVDLHFRVDVGEVVSYAIIPFVLLFVLRFYKKQHITDALLLSVFFALLIFSHQATALFSLLLIGAYLIFLLCQNKKFSLRFFGQMLFYFTCCLIVSLLLSLPAWLPYLFLTKYTLLQALSHSVTFLSLQELLYSKWRYGLLFQGPRGQLGFLIGYTELLVIFFNIVFLFKKTDGHAAYRKFWLIAVIFYIFFMTPYSNFLWQTLPIIRLAQIASRLLFFVSICTAVLAGLFVLEIKKSKLLIFLLVCVTIASTILNWGNRRVIPTITDATLHAQLPGSTKDGEGLGFLGVPMWQRRMVWMNSAPKSPAVIVKGTGSIKEIKRNSIEHDYLINNKTPVIVKENTWYFPNWRVKSNGKNIPIVYKNPRFPGMITFRLASGKNHVEVFYTDVTFLTYAKIFSMSLFVIILIFLLMQLKLLQRKEYNKPIK